MGPSSSTDIASRESSPMRSLERALHLLTVMETAGRPLSATELGRAAQLSPPTVLRILSVLDKYGFAAKSQGHYRLGVALLPLAYSFLLGDELTRAALPVLQELAQASEETASLFVRLGFQRVVVQRVEGRHPLRYILPIGQRLPLHLGMGKVLAAAMPKEELRQMIDLLGNMQLATGARVTGKAMLAELENIRRQGYAVSRNERAVGTTSVGAPVCDSQGRTIAAVAVVGSSDRMTPKKIERLSIEVRGAAKAIAERYGGG
ncbi:MAG: IclR family transcriptional regulator [Syntrophales bacterium]